MCVRIDSYESEEHQKYVRTFLNGRFENSAFCVLSPDGQDWLTRANRGPEMVLGRRDAAAKLRDIADLYPATANLKEALVPDFHSVRQALNVASADQRVLVVSHGSQEVIDTLRVALRSIANDESIIGRVHFDFEADSAWKKTVSGLKLDSGIAVIRPGEFGMDGEVMYHLPVDVLVTKLKATLRQANEEFARSTKKKVYSTHVAKGREENIYFEGAVPYGEDRDGDGEIDRMVGGRGRRGGR